MTAEEKKTATITAKGQRVQALEKPSRGKKNNRNILIFDQKAYPNFISAVCLIYWFLISYLNLKFCFYCILLLTLVFYLICIYWKHFVLKNAFEMKIIIVIVGVYIKLFQSCSQQLKHC